jgi:hypothetical protein
VYYVKIYGHSESTAIRTAGINFRATKSRWDAGVITVV